MPELRSRSIEVFKPKAIPEYNFIGESYINTKFQIKRRYFIITKALRGYYKNPKQIAHKVLADRMALRAPGNKPKTNDNKTFFINFTLLF